MMCIRFFNTADLHATLARYSLDRNNYDFVIGGFVKDCIMFPYNKQCVNVVGYLTVPYHHNFVEIEVTSERSSPAFSPVTSSIGRVVERPVSSLCRGDCLRTWLRKQM